jgi:hypothetical protein
MCELVCGGLNREYLTYIALVRLASAPLHGVLACPSQSPSQWVSSQPWLWLQIVAL